MKNEIARVLSVAGCAEALFLSSVFLWKGKTYIERSMALIMLILASAMLPRYFFAGGALSAAVCLSLATIPALALIGPLVLSLVSRIITGEKAKHRARLPFILAPSAFFLAYSAATLLFSKGKSWPRRLEFDSGKALLSFSSFSVLLSFFNGTCLILCFRQLARFRALLKDHFSDISKLGFAWLKGILIFMALISVLDAGMPIAWIVEGRGSSIGGLSGLVPGIADLALVFFVALFAFIHPDVFRYLDQFYRSPPELRQGVRMGARERPKYLKQAFPTERRKECLERIRDFMSREKPYLHEKLTIVEFSEMIGLPVHLISMTINSELSQNFYAFINNYRIEAAKDKLRSQECMDSSILDIAYEVGFNSKSTFNAIFKRSTGTTPKKYRTKA
jgi:AraC-like DNA-binding protein